MKELFAITMMLLTITASAQNVAPDGYFIAPSRNITGDFDGNGTTETLTQFITDSLHRPLKYLENMEAETWDDYVYNFSNKGYSTAVALSGGTADTLLFNHAQGVYLLISLGNINKTKGDEIAVIPDSVDQSRRSTCYIYSLCKGKWKQVFEFSVHEDAFDYTGNVMPIYTSLPGILEKRKNVWCYYDYLEMDYEKPEDVGKTMPLKVASCN